MAASSFYSDRSPRRTRRFVTFLQACERAADERSHARNVVVLPPVSGDQAVDSDVEDVDDILDSDEEAFEPARELEVESESDDEEQQPEDPSPKRPNAPRGGQWRKRSVFTTVLISEDCNPVLVEYPELALESEFSLWQDFCTLDLSTAIADQTNHYANRDKNKPHFVYLLPNLPSVSEYCCCQVIIACPERPIIGQTSLI